MNGLELLSSEHFHVVLHSNKIHSLLINRLDGTFSTIDYEDAKELSNLTPTGHYYGIVGIFLDRYLVLIKNRSYIGSLYEPCSQADHDIYVITQVEVVPIYYTNSTSTNNNASSVRYAVADDKIDEAKDACDIDKHNEPDSSETPYDFSSLPITISTNTYDAHNKGPSWNPFKITNPFKPRASSSSASEQSNTNQQNIDGIFQPPASLEDSDKRLIEEMSKLFNSTNSFYFSPTLDLTNNFSNIASLPKVGGTELAWKHANERFFWNKYMLRNLIELSQQDSKANHFICVILQGFIAIETIRKKEFRSNRGPDDRSHMTTNLDGSNSFKRNASANDLMLDPKENLQFQERYPSQQLPQYQRGNINQLALVSRRSVYQAGTRYRRRGCDSEGNCANFVETEQVFRTGRHFTSVVLVRGSIPLYWYQTGYNYRPPPVLNRTRDENAQVFRKHYEQLMRAYKTGVIISVDCTESTGREKAIHDAFGEHMAQLKQLHPDLKFIEFDFHKLCKGRQCSDIQVERQLQSCGLNDQLVRDIKYYWNDREIVCQQDGVFRVNCLDCSDRTNVVQKSIALKILDLQVARLGIIDPNGGHEHNEFRKIMQQMWSTNGDALSTQYCGTKALFSNGDKKLSGYLQDTYSSASRYYYSKFRDAYRQAAIDAMLGVGNNTSGQIDPIAADLNEAPAQLLSGSMIDPIFRGRASGAILKDVSRGVTNRFSKLKDRFQVRPSGNLNNIATFYRVQNVNGEPIEHSVYDADGELPSTLGELNIDWPSTESIENAVMAYCECETDEATDTQLNCNLKKDRQASDSDQYSHLTGRLDLTDLQKLNPSENTSTEPVVASEPEEIDLRETSGISKPNVSATSGRRNDGDSNEQANNATSTTSA